MRIFSLLCILVAVLSAHAAPLKTERVILVTADGLRHQELFGGLDPLLVEAASSEDKEVQSRAGVQDVEKLKELYWRETPEERREVLFPFFWGTLVKQGILLGNPAKNSSVKVTNPNKVSYPGYAEVLTGKPQMRIWGNLDIPNPQTTVLEFIQEQLGLDYKGVAAFTSWKTFHYIVAHKVDAFYANTGYEAVPAELATPGMEPLNSLQFEMLTPWDSVRFDTVTLTLALEFLKAHQPKAMYLSLGETDDWAHNRRYDRTIHACRLFDDALKTLWETLQSMDAYRDKTSLVITVDHGRGSTIEDWTSHGKEIPNCEHIWTAVIGPDTPDLGELENTPGHTQGQAAATVAKFLGLDYNAAFPDTAPPIAEAFGE
jgi:hypothetical protein